MYKTLFWIAIVSWIVLTANILKSGGAFVPRVEELEARVREFEDLKFMSEVMRTQVNQLRPR